MRKDAIRIARKLGIPLSRRDANIHYSWNGKSIATKNLSTSDLWHEIAHWLVATPKRRKYINFGLGDDNKSFKKVPEGHHVVHSIFSQHEEELASILGIAYEAFFEENFIKTLEDHHWVEREIYNHRTKSGKITSFSWKNRKYKSAFQYCGNPKFVWERISELNSRGLLKHHQPVLGIS